jgi:hypothetical protein
LGERVYLLVTPEGVPLYTFSDLHAAATEAAALNAGGQDS